MEDWEEEEIKNTPIIRTPQYLQTYSNPRAITDNMTSIGSQGVIITSTANSQDNSICYSASDLGINNE